MTKLYETVYTTVKKQQKPILMAERSTVYGRIFTYEKTAKTIADVKMFMKNWCGARKIELYAFHGDFAIIHTVNGDGSKTAKIIKRQC